MTKAKNTQTMEQLLASTKDTLRTFKYGDLVEGVVISMSRTQAFVDLGAKSEGIIGRTSTRPSRSRPSRGRNAREHEDISTLSVGDRILAKVIQSENDQGYIVLSLSKAAFERAWRRVLSAQERGDVLSVTVTDSNKGGLVVDYQGLSGFIPFSHLQSPADVGWLGKTLEVKVIETDRALNRIVFSQRLAAFSSDADLKKFLKKIASKRSVRGKVVQLLPFGAVVQIVAASREKSGSVPLEGLLHVSEISWSRLDHPQEMLKVGDAIEVAVLGFDESQGRLSLSMKALAKSPWEGIEKQYKLGQKVKGTITKIVPFGAFLMLPEGIEGLIHVSETIGPLEVGEKVEAVIINLEPEKQKLGLSIKRLKKESFRKTQKNSVNQRNQ